jgi:hypothetical protein
LHHHVFQATLCIFPKNYNLILFKKRRMSDIVSRELQAFALGVLGMSAEDVECLTPARCESLLKLKLAYESKDAAHYACATVDAPLAMQIRDWNALPHRSPPAFYRYIFSKSEIARAPQALERFKEHLGVTDDDAMALRMFHAINLGCPRDEMLDACDNNKTRANAISNQIHEYAEHVEGGDRSIFQEEWAHFLKDGIKFPFFYNGEVLLGNSAAAAGGGGVSDKKKEDLQELAHVDRPIPFVSEDIAISPVSIVGNPLLDAYRRRARVPVTFALPVAARQLVSALVCKRVPAELLHRDQDAEEALAAVHGLPHLTREHFGPLVKASVNVEAIRDSPECREYYWKGAKGNKPVGDTPEFVADVLWSCVQAKKEIKLEHCLVYYYFLDNGRGAAVVPKMKLILLLFGKTQTSSLPTTGVQC